MKKSLYDSLLKVIKYGEFNNYECFRDKYSIDYKFDGDLNVLDFIDDIIEYADELQSTIPNEDEEDDGCYITFKLNEHSVLTANYQSKIDWVRCGHDLLVDFEAKLNDLGIQRFLNFEHKHFSTDNFILNVNLYLKTYPFDINCDTYSLKYKIDDLVIDIVNEDLKIEIINILKETLLNGGYACLYPIYNGVFEMLLIIENNEVVVFDEYYNNHIINVMPE
jgi:hypothetical protein